MVVGAASKASTATGIVRSDSAFKGHAKSQAEIASIPTCIAFKFISMTTLHTVALDPGRVGGLFRA